MIDILRRIEDKLDLLLDNKYKEFNSKKCIICGEDHGGLQCPKLTATSSKPIPPQNIIIREGEV